MKKLILAASLVLAATHALALYKVVGPDGKVTYTDRPPVDTSSKVMTMGSQGTIEAAADIGLPIELRQVTAKYPVTLYTAPDCVPCDSARQLLQQRGVPYVEKRVVSEEDVEAFERLVGGRTVPGATIGAQQLRGLNAADWTSYLDAAGYPRESRLPRGWQAPAVTSVVAAKVAAPAAAASSPASRVTPPPAAPVDSGNAAPGGIKF